MSRVRQRVAVGHHAERAAEAALRYLERHDYRLEDAGDSVGDDIDRALEELEALLGEEKNDVRPLVRPLFERLAALSLVWLTCAPQEK